MEKDVGTTHSEAKDTKTTEVRHVQNVAFADATAKAQVSPWTKRMFQVSVDALSISSKKAYLNAALCVFARCNTQFVHQRL